MSEVFAKPINILEEVAPRESRGVTESTNSEVVSKDTFDNVEVPASLHEERHGTSIVADVFNVGENNNTNIEIVQQTKAIDNYILDEIDEQDLEDTKASYMQVLKQTMRMLGVTENDLNKVERIYNAIILRKFITN